MNVYLEAYRQAFCGNVTNYVT